MINQKKKFIYPFLIFFILFFILNQFSLWYENKLKNKENKVISSELKAHATSIEKSINKRFIILDLLEKHVKQNINNSYPFSLENENLKLYVKTLFNSVEGIRVLQISPKGIHKFVYPLRGNEKTLNRNLFEDKRDSVIKMLKVTKNSENIITNAPYELRQGGFGLVARKAVRDQKEFWGFIVMVLDMTYILEETDILNKEGELNLAIYQDEKFIFGDKSLKHDTSNKIPLIIANQKLTLVAENKVSLDSTTLLFINIAILFISILSAFIIYILLNRQMKLESSIVKSMKKLKEKNLELEALIQEAPNPIMVHNEEGKVLVVNKIWLKITKYSFEEIDTIDKWTKNAYGLNNKKIKQQVKSLFSLEENREEGEFIINTKDKEKRIWQFNSVPFGTINGKKTIISSAMDITELREKDNILLQQSKRAAIGEMLENIAHQWRQPLSIISTASTGILLQEEAKISTSENIKRSMNLINESTQYLSKTIDYFRDFLLDSEEMKLLQIKNTIDKTLDMLSSKFKNKDIEIKVNIEDITYKCIENELIQTIMSILSNAKDALEKVENKKFIFIDIYKNEQSLIIKIKDTGGGIEKNILEKVFEPYFTTKHKSQGTGIGLFMTDNIIRKHLNGTIQVASKEFEYENINYKGAEFTISLPLEN